MAEIKTTIGERIKERRIELKISQEELAHAIGYKSRSSINKIEMGVHSLRQIRIKAIADALDTTPDYIMGWSEEDDKVTIKPKTEEEIILELFCKLNSEGRKRIRADLEILLESPRFTRGDL